MRKPTALTVTLALLVVLPSGVLAWLGLKSADAYEASELQGLRAEVRVEADRWRERAGATAAAVRTEVQRIVDFHAHVLAGDLPGLEGAAIAQRVRRTWARLDDGVLDVVDLRIEDASGRTLFPVAHRPRDGVPTDGLRTREGLLAHLRSDADRAYYAGSDGPTESSEAQAVAVWARARAAAGSDAMRARCDVEIARIHARAGAVALLREIHLLEETWDEPVLVSVGRPALILWLELLRVFRARPVPGDDAHALVERIRARVLRLARDGTIDATPLTRAERARAHDAGQPRQGGVVRADAWLSASEARGLAAEATAPPHASELQPASSDAPSAAPAAPGVSFRSPLAGGASLVVRITPASITRKYIEMNGLAWILDPQARIRSWVPGHHAGPADADAAEAAALAFRKAAGARVDVPMPGGETMPVALEVNRWRDVYEAVTERRRATSVGILALMLVTLAGAWLIRRAVLREREARRVRDDFIANVTHEVRTPLTSVLLHSEMLIEEQADDAKRKQHAAIVQAQGKRLAALVGDMLDFAALERGTRTLENSPVDLVAACEEAIAPYRVLAERDGSTVTFDPPAGETVAMADPAALARILGNLMGNAWKHGRPSRDGHVGRIRIVAHEDAKGGSVEVRDDGPGIPPEERARVFERFGRGRAAIRKEGSGIGLSLSHDLARAMGGDLSVHEANGETVFRLQLPPVPELDLE